MRVNEIQREALNAIVGRFLSTGEPAIRIQLVKQLKNPDLVDDMVPVILRNPLGDKLFPTALAFQCCGDPEALWTAKKSVETVIFVLQKLFNLPLEKMDFTIAELEQQARTMFPTLESPTIRLGLYLLQDFSGIHAGIGGMWPNLTSVRIHERLGLLQNVAAAWDEHVAKYSLYLAGNSDGHAQSATTTPTKPASPMPPQENAGWDFFISHASEDKPEIARPLADALVARGLKVWYDDFSLVVGDSLRQSIDRGLSRSKFGIVILSHHFFAKDWPQKELNALATLEVRGRKVILPLWHKVGPEDVRSYSPLLADRVAIHTKNSMEDVVAKLLTAAGLQPDGSQEIPVSHSQMAIQKPRRRRQKAATPPATALDGDLVVTQSTGTDRKVDLKDQIIPDNFLLGARNAWAALLEECWPEIGWSLLYVRDSRNGTIEHIRKAFEPVKGHAHNPGLAEPFYCESSEPASPADFLKNAGLLDKQDAEIVQIQAKRDAYWRQCQDAQAALKVVEAADVTTIQDEASRRAQQLREVEDNLQNLKSQRDALDAELQRQTAYVYRSELLDFLCKGKSTVNPPNLSNALAGLPRMTWQHSFERCSKMPFNHPRFEYSVFEAISTIWGQRSKEFEDPPVEFFRVEVPKLSKETGSTRQFLCENWSDLKNAITECWATKEPSAPFPFALTSFLMRNVRRQKNAAERLLADREKLAV
jgi:TIR domain